MAPRRLVELSHPIRSGLLTLPNLPGPEISAHMSHEQSVGRYAPGTTFEIGRISMVGNTGTYVDAPRHRFPEGADLSGLPLHRLVGVPAVVVDVPGGQRAVDVPLLQSFDVAGKAVLLRTGYADRFGTPEYVVDAPFLTRSGAEWLVAQGVGLVGIDGPNIDDMGDGERPAHTVLLAAGVPVVEHLTGLGQLPTGDTGGSARFTAVPPMIEGLVSFPVRAFAEVED